MSAFTSAVCRSAWQDARVERVHGLAAATKKPRLRRGLKCHLPEGNPSLARRVALTMRAFAARVTRFFGRSTNRPVVSRDSCAARGGGTVGWSAPNKCPRKVFSSVYRRRSCAFPLAAKPPARFRTIQVYPKDLRALPGHPEPAVSWHSGFRGPCST